MGDALSRAEERRKEQERRDLDRFVKELPEGPDLRVNKKLVMFTGLNASDSLRQHYETRKMEAGDCAADWIRSLVEKLGAFSSAPEVAGLGALAIAIIIDVASFSPPEKSMKDALRCVFAEEKASEVWDHIDECLKRCTMHINNKDKLRSDIERIECQLSAALTKLKNSMVRDGHMTSRALKAWVNGAAFHVQMLIHLVRLGGIQTCDPVERLLEAYQRDLDTLFRKHKEVIQGKCNMTGTVVYMTVLNRCLVDEESKRHYIHPDTGYDKCLEAYYDHRYDRQRRELQTYFSDIRQKLQELVHQRGSFRIN